MEAAGFEYPGRLGAYRLLAWGVLEFPCLGAVFCRAFNRGEAVAVKEASEEQGIVPCLYYVFRYAGLSPIPARPRASEL